MGSGQGLIIDEGTGKNIAVAYDNADAQLIAAAPELLQVLVEVSGRLALWAEIAEDDRREDRDALRNAQDVITQIERGEYG